jgi:hypothetical protein
LSSSVLIVLVVVELCNSMNDVTNDGMGLETLSM